MKARRWVAWVWALTGLFLALAFVKSFVADVYRVDSGSMRPTLFGGRGRADGLDDSEHVLVLYGHRRPQRFDLVVVRPHEGDKPLVKRVCGMPGDQDLMIRDGDLYLGRALLPPEVPRPEPVPVYDDRYLDPEAFFEYRRDGSVRREAEAWVVRGEERAPGNRIQYHPELRDDYLDRHHRQVPGLVEVNDAMLALEFLSGTTASSAPTSGESLRLELVEAGDVFVGLVSVEGTSAHVRLVREGARTEHSEPAAPETLAETRCALEPTRWCDLLLANVDNALTLRSRVLGLELHASYERNRPWPEPLPAGRPSLGSRVRFGVQGGTARFRAVRILRDLYYTQDGSFAAHEPITLGPEQYFLLGDNSAASTDSRHFGPRSAADLLGRPVAVVWPRPRWLRATGMP